MSDSFSDSSSTEGSPNGKDFEWSKDPKRSKVVKHKKKLTAAEKHAQISSLLSRCGFFSKFIDSKVESLFETNTEDSGNEPSTSKKRKQSDDATYSSSSKVVKLNDGTPAPVEDADDDKEDGCEVPFLGYVMRVKQPKLLDGGTLRDYQLQGLQWLSLLFENGLNGILADEMGLGKTLQTVGFICQLYERELYGPFLIISPLSTLPNWKTEVNRFSSKVPVILYHGTLSERMELRTQIVRKYKLNKMEVFPLVLTSYTLAIRDKKYLTQFDWKLIVVDEGHRLKNKDSVLFSSLHQYRTINNLLLTGTPLQNNLTELWSLLHFILPDLFTDESFNDWLNMSDDDLEDTYKIVEEETGTTMLSALHKIIRPFILRRVKADVAIHLPPKREIVVYCPMSQIQIDLCMHVFVHNNKKKSASKLNLDLIIPDNPDGSRPKRLVKKPNKLTVSPKVTPEPQRRSRRISESSPSCSFSSPLPVKLPKTIAEDKYFADTYSIKWSNIGMALRQIANHPYLLMKQDALPPFITEDIVQISGKMLVLDTLLTKLKERGHKVLIFSTFTRMLNIIEDFLGFRNHSYRRLDGSTTLSSRGQQVKEFCDDDNIFAFLISTRAGGLGINLVSADTVILFDSDWNPQVDMQAQDRCHRIGQTKPVLVYRMVSKGTIDEEMLKVATSKLQLERLVISKGSFKHNDKIGGDHNIDLNELKAQLDDNKYPVTINDNGSVLSDEEWDKLLDRSQMSNASPL